jgi:putative phosphoribosyl transferase
MHSEIQIPTNRASLNGTLTIPTNPTGLVLFVHGSGSSRHSPRNQYVARILNEAGLATLLFDLLTPMEEQEDWNSRRHRFDIGLLTQRLLQATQWATVQPTLAGLSIGYFGSSTGAAAALVAAAELGNEIDAVVSRGGRPDLAGDALERVVSPTLLIVGSEDKVVIELNEQAQRQLRCENRIDVVPRATHLFDEPGTLERVAELASRWLSEHLRAAAHSSPR